MNITIVAGARPNFVKIAPIIHAIKAAQTWKFDISYRLVHTGQHYDKKMSDDFFEQLGIPQPDVNLGAGGGTQAEQAANVMIRFEQELAANPSDMVLVVGDVTSTMACSIVAKKLNTPLAHVEAGIRSNDLTMPEEINRMVTDAITDYFFTTSEKAGENLRKAGASEDRIFFVGNTMIDTLLHQLPNLKQPPFWDRYGLQEKQYFVMTLHRPANVDQDQHLLSLIEEIIRVSRGLPLVFPVHPRTEQIISRISIEAGNLHLVEPLSYLEFNYLVKHAKAVITDSGGITEETTVMGVPCMTLRDNTERPETCTVGTNKLLGTRPEALRPAMDLLFEGKWQQGGIPELWDGKAAGRIINRLIELSGKV
jgi:UDP-N-acetylglucosamine 2-epimerase (non-hydrolysing)